MTTSRHARRARAKVNLRLRVLDPDSSGYHAIETIFLALQLADEVTITAGGDKSGIEVLGDPKVPQDSSNLCLRALELFMRNVAWSVDVAGSVDDAGLADAARRESGLAAPAGSRPPTHLRPQQIRLVKHIPTGAGLGGGSADAAATLEILNERAGHPLSPDQLLQLGGELGSDVPFALSGYAMALGWERGRRMLPIPPPPPRPVLLLAPPFSIGTAEAYGWLRSSREGFDRKAASSRACLLPAAAALGNWEALAEVSVNDFEGPVFDRHPELAVGKQLLLAAGAQLALLSGSGSCLFGVFEDSERRDQAAERAAEAGEFSTIRTETAATRAGG